MGQSSSRRNKKKTQVVEAQNVEPGNKWSRPESRPKSVGCSRDEMMDEAASKAERIRASRGDYEVEVTCTGEHGLHQTLIDCKKNRNHRNFIPTNNFSIDHLPHRYRDNLLVDYVRATSDITCRLSVSHISKDRPETWPDSDHAFPLSGQQGENSTTVGTGWVSRVYKYTKNNWLYEHCPCEECLSPGTHTPKKTWGEITITTACHVVYNTEEARHTTCQFFYDSPETDINKVPTLTGLEVLKSDIKGDKCEMVYVTHDVDLLDRFDQMYYRWLNLRDNVFRMYGSKTYPCRSVPGVDHDLCIVVSHPHGCTKEISVGTWTQRRVVNKSVLTEYITYSYNTPTCPGSSGAAVTTLYKNNWLYGFHDLPAHSQGRPGNDNNSGEGEERI